MLKITLILLIFIALNNNGNAQSSDSNIQTYDSLLAKKYGADDYGMKQFIMAFLKSGKNILTDKAEEDRLQSEHMKNINKIIPNLFILLLWYLQFMEAYLVVSLLPFLRVGERFGQEQKSIKEVFFTLL